MKEAEVGFFKGLAMNKPGNIRLLLAEKGIAPWSIPHIGFFEKEKIMEVIYYIDDKVQVRNALEKFSNVKRIKAEKFLNSLSPPAMNKLYTRMESIKKSTKCPPPVTRLLRIFKKKYIDKTEAQNTRKEEIGQGQDVESETETREGETGSGVPDPQ